MIKFSPGYLTNNLVSFRYRLFLRCLLLFIAIFSNQRGIAQGKIHVSEVPKWVTLRDFSKVAKPSSKEIKNGAYLDLFEEQINIEQQSDYNHTIVSLTNENGVQNNSQVEIRFDPTFQQLTFHRLRIIRNGKNIDLLNPDGFEIVKQESDLSRFLYNGTYTALFILEDVRVGDKIEYDYTLKGFNPVFNGMYFEKFYFQSSSPAGCIYFSIISLKGKKIYSKLNNDAPVENLSQLADGSSKYEWIKNNIKAQYDEDYEPSWYDGYPSVQVTEMSQWSEVVDWTLKTFPETSRLSPLMMEMTDKWKKESKDVWSYAQKCVRFVQDEIRYMGIENNVYSHKPHDPSQVIKQRYGDCKDKSLLLCALLKANNIESYPCLVNTRMAAHTSDLLPSTLDFNHCICLLIIDDEKIWVDPTYTLQRGSIRDIYFPEYGKALVVKQGENSLTDIRESSKGNIDVQEQFEFHEIGMDGFLKVRSMYSGSYADNIRNDLQSNSIENLQKSYLDFYANLYDSLEVEEPVSYEDNDTNNTVFVYESYRLKNIWKLSEEDTNKFYFDFSQQLLKYNFFSLPKKERQGPVAIKYPVNMDYTIAVTTPEGWNVKEEQVNVNNEAFQFMFKSMLEPKGFTLKYSYQALKEDIPLEKVKQFAVDMDKVYNNLGYSISWRTNESAKSNASGFKLNISFLLIAIFILLMGSYVSYRVYKMSLSPVIYSEGAIGGWMLVPLIGLITRPFITFRYFYTSDLFNSNYIPQIKAASNLDLEAIIIFEIIINLLLLCLAMLCLIAFFKKRDILPRLLITLLVANAIFLGADSLWVSFYSAQLNTEPDYSDFAKAVFGCLIWVPFFLMSVRVKSTFTVPYGGYKPKHFPVNADEPFPGNDGNTPTTEISDKELPLDNSAVSTETKLTESENEIQGRNENDEEGK